MPGCGEVVLDLSSPEQQQRDSPDGVGLGRAGLAGQHLHSRIRALRRRLVAGLVCVSQGGQDPAQVAEVGVVEGVPQLEWIRHDVTALAAGADRGMGRGRC